MATHKINISTSATWFEVSLKKDAFWTLPDSGEELYIDSKNAHHFNVQISKRYLLFSADDEKGNGGTSLIYMYVETSEDKIEFSSRSGGQITYSSHVDRFEPSVLGGESGVLRLL